MAGRASRQNVSCCPASATPCSTLATEEFPRYFTPHRVTAAPSRKTSIRRPQFKEGERLWISGGRWPTGTRRCSRTGNSHPDRQGNRHRWLRPWHRCAGSNAARTVFVDADRRASTGCRIMSATRGHGALRHHRRHPGMRHLPATFTPGKRVSRVDETLENSSASVSNRKLARPITERAWTSRPSTGSEFSQQTRVFTRTLVPGSRSWGSARRTPPFHFDRHTPTTESGSTRSRPSCTASAPWRGRTPTAGNWVAAGNKEAEPAAAARPSPNDHDIAGARRGYRGINIPLVEASTLFRGGMLEMDDPEHRAHRTPLNAYLSPAAVQRWCRHRRDRSGPAWTRRSETGRTTCRRSGQHRPPAVLTLAPGRPAGESGRSTASLPTRRCTHLPPSPDYVRVADLRSPAPWT